MDLMDLLADPAYRHMLLNHVPIVGLAMAWLVLAAGICCRQYALQITGLVLVTLTAGSSIPVANYGDAAYPAIFDSLDGYGRGWLDYHAHLAEQWLPLFYANTGVAATALIVASTRKHMALRSALLVAVMTLASLSGTFLIGKAGGQINHPEFRLSDPPRVSSMLDPTIYRAQIEPQLQQSPMQGNPQARLQT